MAILMPPLSTRSIRQDYGAARRQDNSDSLVPQMSTPLTSSPRALMMPWKIHRRVAWSNDGGIGSRMNSRTRHPWVESLKGTIGFGLQAVAAHGHGDRGAALIRAGGHAERYGFDAFFLGDHPAWAPDCWLHLSVIAAQTKRIRLGQMVAAAPYRTPLLTARLQSDLDRLSAGRSILGLGIGWNAADYGLGSNEFDRMGLAYPPVPTRQAALEEAVAIIRGVWGPVPYSFSGQHYRAAEAQVDPPSRSGGVPLVIAGGGEKTLGQLARLGDVANFGPGPAGNVDSPGDVAGTAGGPGVAMQVLPVGGMTIFSAPTLPTG